MMNMENQRSPLLGVSFSYFCQGKSVEDELRSSLWYTKLELEKTKTTVQDELRKKEEQLTQLKQLLNKAIRERDEANDKCQTLLLEKLFLQQQNNNQCGISSIEFEDDPRRGGIIINVDSSNTNNGFSSSECEESIVSSPQQVSIVPSIELVCDKPLPEKGKLLQAVMRAGPLLQTLLLAGPLPQWRHPPPPLEASEIPPVTIPSPPPPLQALGQESLLVVNGCGRVNRKRVLCEEEGGGFEFESPSPNEAKYQRVILQ